MNSGPALLLINLGSPAAPTTSAVKAYLKEFLSDPKVLTMPGYARWLLLRLIILPFRSPKSAKAYRLIWHPEHGSPLVHNTRQLAAEVATRAGKDFGVFWAMRYGSPSLPEVLEQIRAEGYKKVVLVPLYPQNADSSTGTALQAVQGWMRQNGSPFQVTWVPPFFDDQDFITAAADNIRPLLGDSHHLLLSYHGLPESHMTDQPCAEEARCLAAQNCCAVLRQENRDCYRAQCYATSAALTRALGLVPDRVHTAFQSRLGRAKWIEPYTDAALMELPKSGVKKLVVACPAFTADCLETLEEIAIRGRESFLGAGGESFHYAPAVNAHPVFAAGILRLSSSPKPLPG